MILKALNLAGRLTIDIVEVNHSTVITLAKETGLTTYDASYVWLAKQLKGELVTLDAKMLRVVKRY
jgi:predicted nucleic acid-binding protein